MVMISGFSLPAKARHYIQYLYSIVCVFPAPMNVNTSS